MKTSRIDPINFIAGALIAFVIEMLILEVNAGVPSVSIATLLTAFSAIVVVNLARLTLRFGRQRLSVGWDEAAFGSALFLLPLQYIPLTILVATALSQVLRHKASKQKIIFSAASQGGSAELVTLIIAFIRHATGVPLQGIGMVVLGTAVFSLLNLIILVLAITLAEDRSYLKLFQESLPTSALVTGGNILISLLAYQAWITSSWLLIVLPPLLYGMHVLYDAKVSAERDRHLWADLANATGDVHELDERKVLQVACQRAIELFGAEVSEVILGNERTGRHFWVDEHWMLQASEFPRNTPIIARHEIVTTGKSVGMLILYGNTLLPKSDNTQAQMDAFCHWLGATLGQVRLFETAKGDAIESARVARLDKLTGIYNRDALIEAMSIRCAVNSGQSGLLICDLARFRSINDTLGYEAADRILKDVATLITNLAPDAFVARLGSDEFAIFAGDANANRLSTYANNVQAMLSNGIAIEDSVIGLEAACGYAVFGEDCDSVTEMLRKAEIAMYAAKASSTLVMRYIEGMESNSSDALGVLPAFTRAMENDHIHVVFQPQYRASDHALLGAEALARWNDPNKGALPPDQWVPVVEQSGVVLREFTRFVLRKATTAAAMWPEPMTVAVNLSARSLMDDRLPGDVEEALMRSGLTPSRLICEVTETAVIRQPAIAHGIIAKLRKLGVKIAIDDFGTGYSTMAVLASFKVDEIKIDKSFVSGMKERENEVVVKTILFLARQLNVATVAEGVETAEHAAFLKQEGCDALQGYLFSPGVSHDIMLSKVAQSVIAGSDPNETHNVVAIKRSRR